VEERLRRLEEANLDLKIRVARLRLRQRVALWGVTLLAIGHVIASQFFVLPWRRVAHYDRVTANRFEVPNRISSEYEFYHNVKDRPDAVFGWVSNGERRLGQWGGREHEREQIKRGDGPGLYIRTPRAENQRDKDDVKLGVLPGHVSVP
jgi:hypothetical protein